MAQRRIHKPRPSRPPGASVRRELTPDEARQVRGAREDELAHKDELIATSNKVRRAIEAADAALDQAVALLKDERFRQGVSLAEMQNRTGLTSEAIGNVEALEGEIPSLITLCRIADALGVELFMGLERTRQPTGVT